jgi:hypothetical protein
MKKSCSLARWLVMVGSLPWSVAATLSTIRAEAIPVKVTGDAESGFQLLRGGVPFVIRGVGGTSGLDTLAACGGNAIRTWDAEAAAAILDSAHAAGITVTVGLWLGHERHGFDYRDHREVEAQRRDVVNAVDRLKDHPAVLAWGLGNEMEGPGGPGDSPAIWGEVEQLARLVKQRDPHHPVMTVVANVSPRKLAAIREHAPGIDVLGINAYADAGQIGDKLRAAGWEKPYCITEFGLPGPWEAAHTDWNAPIEPSSREKAALTFVAWEQIMADRKRCLGSYAFLWGSKQEATASWFGILMPGGEKTPRADALARAWTGAWPADRAPILEHAEVPLACRRVRPGETFKVRVVYRDPESARLRYRWDVREESTDRRSGGDAERAPAAMADAVAASGDSGMAVVTAPERPGAYRLFVTVFDGHGSGCMENWPFHVDAPH